MHVGEKPLQSSVYDFELPVTKMGVCMHVRFRWPATLLLALTWMSLAHPLNAASPKPANCLAEAKAALADEAQPEPRIVECLITATTDLQARIARLEKLTKHPVRLSPPAYSTKSGTLTPGGQR
jgi:hypothetical protein